MLANNTHSNFNLDLSVPYLLNKAGRRSADVFRTELVPYNISIRMWRVLAVVYYHEELKLFEVSTHTGLDVSVLSRMVGTLQRKGLLLRERPADNSRVVSISLTPEGKRIAEEIILKAKEYEAHYLKGFSPEDVNQLRSLLRQLYDNMADL